MNGPGQGDDARGCGNEDPLGAVHGARPGHMITCNITERRDISVGLVRDCERPKFVLLSAYFCLPGWEAKSLS